MSIKHWKLRTRLTLAVLTVLVPLLFLELVSHLQNQDQRRESEVQNSAIVGETIAAVVEGFVRDLESLTLASSLALGSQQQPLNQETTGQFLRQLFQDYGILRALFLADLDGRVIATQEGTQLGFDLSSRPYFVALKEGQESVWTGGISGVQSGQVTITHARTVRGPDDSPRAYLIVAFYPEQLAERLPSDLPANSRVTFLDDEGKVLYSSMPLSVALLSDVSDDEAIAAALGGQQRLIQAYRTPFQEEKRFGAFVPIARNGWVVGFTRPQSALDQNLQNRFWRDIALMAAVMVAAAAVLWLLTSYLSRPLTNLADTAKAIAAGERPLIPTAGAAEEIHQLEEAMDFMSRAVGERQERLSEQARILSAVEGVGETLASELDFQRTIRTVADAARELTGAQYAAFLYNTTDDRSDQFPLYALSGLKEEEFSNLPSSRKAAVFGSTFAGQKTLRLDDVTKDVRYGDSLPSFGVAHGDEPVRSYLAAPVVSGSGQVVGGLFLAHSRPKMFEEKHESLVAGIARWAAIAIDNARLFQESEEIREQLRKANEAKDEFLGVVSHELRTPTTTIYGGARLLRSRAGSLTPEQSSEMLEDIERESERLFRLVEDLLTLAKLELGEHIEAASVEVSDVVERVQSAFKRSRPSRPIEVNLDANLVARGEPTYVEQILRNLVSNADKYSPPGLPITIEAKQNGDETITVSVMDRGPGVEAGEAEAIFDRFYRSERTSRSASGLGIGLTVCKRLVEAQSGEIFAKQREGGGLAVIFSLPSDDPVPEAIES